MTDNEIIKAETDNRREYVERIVNAVNYKGSGDHEDVWSILWEYQEENRDTINRQKAEIERLQGELEQRTNAYFIKVEQRKNARAEAIKEFAERLKEFTVYVGEFECHMVEYFSIEQLVKEMVGD